MVRRLRAAFYFYAVVGGVEESAAHRRHLGSASAEGLLWDHGGLYGIRIQA